MKFEKSLLALALAGVLTACGGSSGGRNGVRFQFYWFQVSWSLSPSRLRRLGFRICFVAKFLALLRVP